MPPSSALQLAYAFTTNPDAIHASVPGANPEILSLTVLISNPTGSPVEMDQIIFTIPVGSDLDECLSASASLPGTVVSDDPGNWALSVAGSHLILSALDTSISFSGKPLTITLSGIVVNTTAGTVALQIAEFSSVKFTDKTTYKLIKLPAQSPVLRFYSEPAAAPSLGVPVNLKWECNSLGQEFTYQLRSADPQQKFPSCISGANCYGVADGIAGVSTAHLSGPTEFFLDVVQPQTDGSRTIQLTYTLAVNVAVPRFSGVRLGDAYLAGRIVMLHWLAVDAHHCKIHIKDQGGVLADNLPLDTYIAGYPVMIGKPGTYTLWIGAYDVNGNQLVTQEFAPDVTVAPTMDLNSLRDGTFSPDSGHAIAFGQNSSFLFAVAGSGMQQINMPPITGIDGNTTALFLDNDRLLLIFSTSNGPLFRIYGLHGGSLTDYFKTTLAWEPYSRDGVLAKMNGETLFLHRGMGWTSFVRYNLDTGATLSPSVNLNAPMIGKTAVTADGVTVMAALDTSSGAGPLLDTPIAFLDVNSNTLLPANASFKREMYFRDVTLLVTSDGKLLIVACQNRITSIDLSTRAVLREQEMGQLLAILPGSHIGMIIPSQGNTVQMPKLALVDLDTMTLFESQIEHVGSTYTMTLSPDGRCAFLHYVDPQSGSDKYLAYAPQASVAAEHMSRQAILW